MTSRDEFAFASISELAHQLQRKEISPVQLVAATLDRIDAVGGGAQSDAWLSILADIWGVPVRRRTIVSEANSLGAAVTGAVGLGLTDFSAARSLSEVTAEFTPDPHRHSAYAQRHARFSAAYDALEPWFTEGA